MLTFFIALGALLAGTIVLGFCALIVSSVVVTIRKQQRAE
jgi:hypothetical protein